MRKLPEKQANVGLGLVLCGETELGCQVTCMVFGTRRVMAGGRVVVEDL